MCLDVFDLKKKINPEIYGKDWLKWLKILG